MKVLFDNFECVKMAKYYDLTTDGFIDEPIITEEDQSNADEEAESQFWVVQAHVPDGGMESLFETDDEEYAKEMTTFFQTLLQKLGLNVK
ncbi:MAG: hypothetical protein WC119_00570 [Synergistaceae bacterium]